MLCAAGEVPTARLPWGREADPAWVTGAKALTAQLSRISWRLWTQQQSEFYGR